MRLTKVLRAKVENELDKVRHEKDKEARASYEARRKACENEIDKFLAETVNPQLEAILEKNGMSQTVPHWGDTVPATHAILKYYQTEIRNTAEEKKLHDAECERYQQQKVMVDDFALELELGADKSQFMSLLADLCDKMRKM